MRGCGGAHYSLNGGGEALDRLNALLSEQSHTSRCTVSGLKAGKQTAIYSAPSGVLY
jgi:hypothetical protein